jgi:hypothetical protein
MVVLLAVVVIGGLVWLARRNRGGTRTDRARTDGAGPGFLTGRSAESGSLPR